MAISLLRLDFEQEKGYAVSVQAHSKRICQKYSTHFTWKIASKVVTESPPLAHRQPYAIQPPSKSTAFARYAGFRACIASATAPNLFFDIELVNEDISCIIVHPISHSYTLLGFWLLRTKTCVLTLPHATIYVVLVIRVSINAAPKCFS